MSDRQSHLTTKEETQARKIEQEEGRMERYYVGELTKLLDHWEECRRTVPEGRARIFEEQLEAIIQAFKTCLRITQQATTFSQKVQALAHEEFQPEPISNRDDDLEQPE